MRAKGLNEYIINGEVAYLKIKTKGTEVYCAVDTEKIPYLKELGWNWHVVKLGYVLSTTSQENKGIYLHRLLMGTPKGMTTDHINWDRLDNRLSNLRVVTNQENLRNTKAKGIYYSAERKKWVAQIGINYSVIGLGRYKTKEEAIKARKNGEKKYWN